ncbi:MAG TPA: UDP-3-O-[3-hydroxymyristoyl] N-acetylglucosamine deacetylase, partial [Bacteroidetes bacterium]|nr:UDP-3-O-[3-hydroxymyristoyl] N-acetylglucosamine deacetylase [Bacteroidota bacterium]
MKRKTIQNSFTLSGIGLHTGTISKITIKPMPDEHKGIIFIKNDIEIKADVKNVLTTKRSTTLGIKDQSIKTTEHLMSA